LGGGSRPLDYESRSQAKLIERDRRMEYAENQTRDALEEKWGFSGGEKGRGNTRGFPFSSNIQKKNREGMEEDGEDEGKTKLNLKSAWSRPLLIKEGKLGSIGEGREGGGRMGENNRRRSSNSSLCGRQRGTCARKRGRWGSLSQL